MMDWGLGRINDTSGTTTTTTTTTTNFGLRPLLLFTPSIWYYCAIIVDLLLRFIWVTKYFNVPEVIGYNLFMMVMEVVEVMRRSMWSVFRIEWECLSKGHTGYTPKAPVADFFEAAPMLDDESAHDL